MRLPTAIEQTAAPAFASLTFAVMKSQIRALQRRGVSMMHTARSFDVYRRVFYRGQSKPALLRSLQGQRIVDVGCGITPYAKDSMFQLCRVEGIEFYGVDPVLADPPKLGWRERALARALGSRGQFDSKAPGLDRALACSAQKLPFEDACIDQILCSYLLFVWIENESDLADIFNEFHRVLKKGGVVKLYPFYQWQYTRFRDSALKEVLNKFEIDQHFVHGGLDLRVTPSMLTEFTKMTD